MYCDVRQLTWKPWGGTTAGEGVAAPDGDCVVAPVDVETRSGGGSCRSPGTEVGLRCMRTESRGGSLAVRGRGTRVPYAPRRLHAGAHSFAFPSRTQAGRTEYGYMPYLYEEMKHGAHDVGV
jgi:hypothetical protein